MRILIKWGLPALASLVLFSAAPVRAIQITDHGRGADEPHPITRGWWSMRAVSDTHIMPWGGNGNGSTGDNSIKRYDVSNDTWSVIHPDVGHHYVGGDTADTWEDQAYRDWGMNPSSANPPYILDGRDNYMYFHIPDRNEALIYGNPNQNSWGGVYNIGGDQWTHLWRDQSDWGTQGYFDPYAVPGGNDAFAWSMNAAHVWVDPDGSGDDVGLGLAFGGNRFSSPNSGLFHILPSEEPGSIFELQEVSGSQTEPTATDNNRNGAIAVGEYAYFFGGRVGGESSEAVWRYNTVNGQWTRMADMPVASQWNAAAYDPESNLAVVITGSNPLNALVYNLEQNIWTEITDQIPSLPNGVSQPTLAFAGGLYTLMARAWDIDNDGALESRTSHAVFRFDVSPSASNGTPPSGIGNSIPEPGSLSIMTLGLLVFGFARCQWRYGARRMALT